MGEHRFQLEDPDDFPILYRSANDVSLSAQKRFLTAFRIRLGALLAAAVGGVIGWKVGGVHVGGLIALLAFTVALAAELYSALARPDRGWYEGRAAAESAKTLTWRYVVRGESFEGADDANADRRFLTELKEILQDLKDVDLTVDAHDVGSQITPKMRQARALGFDERRLLYLEGRIRDQQRWYSRKASCNDQRGNRWLIAGIVFESLGIILAAARAFAGLDLDLSGVAAAAAATVAAWVQAKQYQNLATAYTVTAQELAAVAAEVEAITEEASWPRFVGEAEEAISREHTLWRASRGLRIRPPRRGGNGLN